MRFWLRRCVGFGRVVLVAVVVAAVGPGVGFGVGVEMREWPWLESF